MTEISSSEPKDATPSVIAQQDAMLNALPFSDTRDFDDAARGFLVIVTYWPDLTLWLPRVLGMH